MEKASFLRAVEQLSVENRSAIALYQEISALAMRYGGELSEKKERNAYYLSMEFLIGRGFYNNLMELGVLEEVAAILKGKGVDISIFEEIEDAALGNGGLGRLAACFLDSAAGTGVPLYGYGIRYRYGLFKQAFENGFQVELPDDWQRFGDPWSVKKEGEKRLIRFADYEVYAVPYDTPVFGKRVNYLRLFEAEGSEQAERISSYLYPPDDTHEGKLLRLRQEYFFSAACVGELCDQFVQRYGKQFEKFPDFHAIQLNDTHPVIAIAEFIRILTAEYRVAFYRAVEIAKKTFAYTNHTVLPEALECWSESLVAEILPEIAKILRKLSTVQRRELTALGCTGEERAELAFYSKGVFKMANLAVFICHSVNGVARLHTDILKETLFRTAHFYYPHKFNNKTNGITHRRWLMLCNRPLCALLDRSLGKEWRRDIAKLSRLNEKIPAIAEEFIAVKREKKEALFAYIRKKEGVELPNGMLVYAQVKRLHEYKRQLMTAFAVLEIYFRLKRGELPDFTPSLFLFGAKSAPSYRRAKGIIKFLNEIAAEINADGQTNGLLRVVFVTDYNVSYAEKIVAGADVSLQVSTAGLEASGTGNMKFMMNGAVTCGTMDGANIEIVAHAGRENNYIFGAEVEEIARFKREGYSPCAVMEQDGHREAVECLVNGRYSDGGTGVFRELYDSLLLGASWHEADEYFVLHDLKAYVDTLLKINADAQGEVAFAVKQLKNVANSAYFSSDRTIEEYAEEIWKV